MAIIKFILANWDSIILVIAVIVALILLYKHGRVGVVKKVLFSLVSRAEKEFGSGTGELKKAAVIEWIYEKLPKIVTVFITPKEIEQLIETVLEYAKTKWAANTALQDYIAPANGEVIVK
ncbi:MAG: hypothetical protein NC452_05285 [Eubacterium sp.]|nr:hypothetical protein [Eubacterium sp.]